MSRLQQLLDNVPVPHTFKAIHHSVYPAIDPSNPRNSASGKTVIISGGAGGIGFAIAQGFSVAGAARVIILARRQEALDSATTKLNAENADANRATEIWTYLLDIRDSSAAESVFTEIRARLNEGRKEGDEIIDADILITSAANLSQGETAVDFDAHAYHDSFETNVVGNMNLVRAFLAPEAPAIPLVTIDGRVKNTSSVTIPTREKIILDVSSSAAYMVLPGQAPYASSKLAFSRAMQSLQLEVDNIEGKPIRIHSFNPGAVYTPGVEKLMEKEAANKFPWDDVNLPGGFAVWLASPTAAFLKGKFVMSRWDVEELMALKDEYEKDPEFGTITLKM